MGSLYYTKRLVTKRPKKGPKAPPRPKAFRTEADAQAWAKKQKLKKFQIVAIADGNKFKIRTRF
jgi:hypothetical protein